MCSWNCMEPSIIWYSPHLSSLLCLFATCCIVSALLSSSVPGLHTGLCWWSSPAQQKTPCRTLAAPLRRKYKHGDWDEFSSSSLNYISPELLNDITWVLFLCGHNLNLPLGKFTDGSFHLSSHILQTLGNRRQLSDVADAHRRSEELLHTRHLSHYISQLVEGSATRGKMIPGETLALVLLYFWDKFVFHMKKIPYK